VISIACFIKSVHTLLVVLKAAGWINTKISC